MNYSPAKTLILFFLGLITIGTVILSFPVSRNAGIDLSFLTSVFTATSSVCVTGLSVVAVNEYFSGFGQTVILLLVQLGGMGYMFVSTVVTLLIGRMALKDRRMMQEIFDISSFDDLKKLLYKAVFFVLAIEIAGAVILTVIFMQDFPFLRACYLGTFHSIMAFCNAGFSVFPDSMAAYAASPAMLYSLSALIILGGLGFFVIVDLYDTYKEKRMYLTTHTKVVISLTAVILIIGFLMFFFSEDGSRGFFYSVNNAFFQSVSARTAGFTSIAVGSLGEFSEIILIFLMSVGAAPGSTAGGVKITTLALVFVFLKSMLKADDDFVLFKKRIPADLVKKAVTIFILFFISVAVLSSLLVLIEPDKRSIDVVFEAVSAFGTVGVSTGITPHLSFAGKILTIIAMITGRIGILTVLIVMLTSNKKVKRIRYPEAKILVG